MNRILLFRDRREENLKIFEIIEFSIQNCVDPSSHRGIRFINTIIILVPSKFARSFYVIIDFRL